MNVFWSTRDETMAVVLSKDDALRYASMLEGWDYGSDGEEAVRCNDSARVIRLLIPGTMPTIETPKGNGAESSAS